MSNFRMLIVALCASLCALGSYAQQPYVLTLEQLFALADENSKSIQAENAAVLEAQQDVTVAKNALMPDIDISLSASYLGNGYLMERNFSNGQTIDMPHLGNNFAVEATQLLYIGGAVTHSIALAKLKEEMANINREATRSRVHFMLTGFYLDLYQARGKELPRWLRATMFVVMLSLWLFLTVMLLWRWYISGHIPMSNGHETMQLMAWLALLVGILSSITYSGSAASYRRSRPIVPSERPATRYASAILISAMALMVSMMTASNPQITLLMPVLQSPLLSMHVSVIMLSYTLFAFMMMNGVVGLFMSEAHQQRMAALNRRILRPAIACLAIGIFIGAVWANISWGRYWGWDPKEVWALITLLVYALPLHSRSLPLFQRPRLFLIYSIIAFAAVSFTYFGVNFLLGGMHSYA